MTDNGVKRRRENRIRAIVEREAAGSGLPAPAGGSELRFDDRRDLPMRSDTWMPRIEEGLDPESEWKRKSKEWLSSGEAPRSSWGGMQPSAERSDGPGGGSGGSAFMRGMILKALVSALLFGGVWGVFELDMPGAEQAQAFVLRGLTEEMDTTAIAAWYQDTFSGAPSFIPIFQQEDGEESRRVGASVELSVVSPVEGGKVARTFAETLGGIEIAAASEAPVGAMETGRVSQVTGSVEAGFSVVVQHASARTSIYGRLSAATVKPGDWVEAGDRIGLMPKADDAGEGLLYFAVQEGGRYVDPLDVIRFD